MCSGTRSAIIVLALPQRHCGCSEASVLRQHTNEVCSGSSKVPLQHGQDPLLAPVSVRHIATVMVLMIEIATLPQSMSCGLFSYSKNMLTCMCSAMPRNCMCFAAVLLHLLCSNAFIPDLHQCCCNCSNALQLHVFCSTCLTAWQQHCCDCIFRTACSPVLYLLCSHLDLGSHTGMKRLRLPWL